MYISGFGLKTYPRPQRPKRPMKARKRQQSPKLHLFFVIITFQCKITNKCENDTKKNCFQKILNFHFHYINVLKLLASILRLPPPLQFWPRIYIALKNSLK